MVGWNAAMQWKKDLELLIAQARALVAPAADVSVAEPVRPAARLIEVAAKADTPAQPNRLTPPFAPMQWRATSREEIKQRVATFKAHQQKFEQEREDFCLRTLARTRASLDKRLEK
jgi:hypothetical protein